MSEPDQPEPYKAQGPFAVVDIGSNSVRLVIFERVSRNPWPLFNEKVVCSIGRGMVTSGLLHEEGTRRAFQALARFQTLARGMNVSELLVVATAAARDAQNGEAFIKKAEGEIGTKIHILTGKEEAELAAMGVVSGQPNADGVVGDLGGGSLELKEVTDGALGKGATLPLGPLRLMDAAGGKMGKAKGLIDDALDKIDWLDRFEGRSLYLVGGVWRNIAQLILDQDQHPLRILQGFAIPAKRVRSFSELLAGMSAETLVQMNSVSARRAEAMPYGALVLDRLLKRSKVKQSVASAYGVREGVLFSVLSDEVRASDPLLEAAADMNLQLSRSPGHALEVHRWIMPLVSDWPDDFKRFEQVVCFLSDIGWRYHPDYRAQRAYERILTMPVAGLTHQARMYLALTTRARYGGGGASDGTKELRKILPDEYVERARVMGLTLRLAYQISGAVAGLLPHSRIEKRKDQLVLTFERGVGPLSGEIVQKRLANLAEALELEPVVEFD